MPMPAHLFKLTTLLTAAFAATACSPDGRPASDRGGGSHDAATLSALRDFNRIEAAGPDAVIVSVGKPFSVAVQGDAKLLDTLDIKVVRGTLKIDRKTGWTSFLKMGSDRGAVIRVAMPAIAGASLTGSGDLSVDKVDGPALMLSLTGAGNMKVDAIRVARLDTDITGSGGITLAGAADIATLSTTGSGDLSGRAFKAGRASVSITGSGGMDFASDGAVEARILGSGDVRVTGRAQCKVSAMGSGEVRCGA
jgi:hypothetical protein